MTFKEFDRTIDPRRLWNAAEFAQNYLRVVDGKNNGGGKRLREEVLYPRILDHLGDVSGKLLLDAGTGEGSIGRLAFRGGARVMGIDISILLLQEAYNRSARQEAVALADINSPTLLPFKADTFDAITCSLVLMWIPDITSVGQEFARISKPGSTIVIPILNPNVDQGVVAGQKAIDRTVKFPYFERSVEDYLKLLQSKPDGNIHPKRLRLQKTEYVRPSLDTLTKYPQMISRTFSPEFVILTFENTLELENRKQAVVLLLYNEKGQALFVHRTGTRPSLPDRWALPSETMENETLGDAVRRAGREELGINITGFRNIETFSANGNGNDLPTTHLICVEANQYTGKIENRVPLEFDEMLWLRFDAFFRSFPDDAKIGPLLKLLRQRHKEFER